jgi:hypothetical protein
MVGDTESGLWHCAWEVEGIQQMFWMLPCVFAIFSSHYSDVVPRAQKVEGPSAAGFPPPHSTQLALLSPICFTDLKGRELATRLCNPQ